MTTERVPYTAFGKTKLVPLNVYVDCKPSDQRQYETTLWVEREEDWYALRKRPTLVVLRRDFLNGELVAG